MSNTANQEITVREGDLESRNEAEILEQTLLSVAIGFLEKSHSYKDQAHRNFEKALMEMESNHLYKLLELTHLNYAGHAKYSDLFEVVTSVMRGRIER